MHDFVLVCVFMGVNNCFYPICKNFMMNIFKF
jgi:hypothetical protein